MAEKHINETHYYSFSEKEDSYSQAKRLYTDRASCGDCHYRIADGNINASIATGEETGVPDSVCEQPAPDRYRGVYVRRGQRPVSTQRSDYGGD